MYKKQLYRAAWISSPILALFELSPIFMLTRVSKSPLTFITGFSISYLSILIIWWANIYIVLSYESKGARKRWKRNLLSYLFITLFTSVLVIIILLHPFQKEPFPLIYNIINIFSLNTIILLISNSVILQLKRIQTEDELSSLKIKTLEAEQQQLIQQLQPHFLFNALSTLKSLIKTDAELAEEYAVKLSDFLRFSVSSHKNKIVPLTDELQFTGDYIELQHIRFAGSFSCSIDIPEKEKSSYVIPIYAFQTLIENAIKHNAFTDEIPLLVKVVFREGYLEVTNNKIPKLVINKAGVGLKNLNKRYELFCGEGIIINENTNSFKVTIKLIPKD